MTSGANDWNRGGKGYVDLRVEASAYIVFADFCSDALIESKEIKTMFGTMGNQVSVFHLSERRALALAHAMGVEPPDWDHARGANLCAGLAGKHVFLSQLRYCASCLVLGHHSTLFQLTQVLKCPIHDEPLEIGCPHCRQPISTGVFDIARNHLYCGNCGRNLAPSRLCGSPKRRVAPPSAGLFTSLRQAIDPGPRANEWRSGMSWDKLPAEVVANPVLMRLHHLHTAWADDDRSDFLKVKTESIRFEVKKNDPFRPQFSPLIHRTVAAFEALSVQLGRHVDLSSVPKGLRSGSRTDEQLGTVAAAFWKTAWIFGVDRLLVDRPRLMHGWQPWFVPWLPDHFEASVHVVRCTMQLLFARCLIRMVQVRYGVQVAWHTPPDLAYVLPPWRLVTEGGGMHLELQIRTRVDEQMVQRLISRYRDCRLLEVPDGMSPLDLVTERPD